MSNDQPNDQSAHPNEDLHKEPLHLDTTWSPLADAMRHDRVIQTTKRGNPIDPADPGSRISRFLAWLITIAFVAMVVGWQNTDEDFKHNLFFQSPAPVIEPGPNDPAPGNFGQVDLVGRLFLRGFDIFEPYATIESIDPGRMLFSDEDSVRLIMLAGELEGTQAALDRLMLLRSDLESISLDDTKEPINNDQILAELAMLETLYTQGADKLEPNQRDQLLARYDYIAKVALTHGLENTDPQRAPLISSGISIGFFVLLIVAILLVVPILGLIFLILGIISFASGKMVFRCRVPAKGGSVFLETYALFVGGFLVMSLGTFFVSYSSKPELASFSLLVQWLLLLTVFWGILRGMRIKDWKNAIGLHTGQGLFKEIGIGIIAYIASIPIYILGVVITVILLFAKEALTLSANNGIPEKPIPMTNPIFEMIASQSFWVVAMLFILATTWAPIVEEAIFRGALYRYLRGSLHWVIAAMFSAILFAFMHDYGPLMVAPLIALGFMFAFMREWRGSLVAPMTAHFLHNFSLMTFMILLVQLIKDPM